MQMNILLADDDPTVLPLIEAIAEDLGHNVLYAPDGATAIRMVEEKPVDLVLMDIEMPGKNGFESSRQIREQLGQQWIPIVFLSGHEPESGFIKGIDAGGDAYLSKPIHLDVARAMIQGMGRILARQRQLESANSMLEQLANIDVLTELSNRRGFLLGYGREWARACREKTPLSLVMIDIDHFKKFNDHYGHPEGDRCLRQVAQALRGQLLRPTDLLARYGGEEFVTVLPGTPLAGATQVAERMRSAVEAMGLAHQESPSGVVTISLGVAEKETHPTPEALVRAADKCLYQAKAGGRNQVHPEHNTTMS